MKTHLSLASILTAALLVAGLQSPVRAEVGAAKATGRMTVTASGLVYTELHVPRPARLSLDYYSQGTHPTPRFSQGSEFGAILLVSEKRRHVTYLAARLEKSPGVAQRLISLGPEFCQLNDFCDVSAGRYRLYVITKRRLRVELEFKGLDGASKIYPATQATGELGGASVGYYHSSPPGLIEVAATGMGFSPKVTEESNYIFSAFWFRGPDEPVGPSPVNHPLLQVGDAGGCRFVGSAPAEAYAPGCPTGDMNGNFSTARALSKFKYLQWGSIANISSGEYSQGNYAVHTGIHDQGFVGFWLGLED